MAYKLADRVMETTTTAGTGTITLAGAKPGYQAFSAAFTNGDTTYYCITNGVDWETGYGTYTTSTLARTTLVASSTGSLLVLSGTYDVFCDASAEIFNKVDLANARKTVTLRV